MVAQAMKQSVRRLRLAEIAAQVPGLIPDRTDAGNGLAPEGAIVSDFANVISKMTTGKIRELKNTPEWCQKKAASLLSAVCGAQWTQTRRAAVPKWKISDNRCRLCFPKLARWSTGTGATATYRSEDGLLFLKRPGWRPIG